jgi:class 3 adenylate cyclase
VELDTPFHVPGLEPAISDQMTVAVEELLTGGIRHSAQRRFASLLFTDIVDSTAQQRRVGDRAWRDVLETHEATTRRLVEQFGGRVVEVEGDGLMAEFPAAGESLRAARAIASAAREQGIHIRAGLHAGEVYQAGADDVLTTEVVAGLVEGSDLTLAPYGELDLKGVGVRRLVRLA